MKTTFLKIAAAFLVFSALTISGCKHAERDENGSGNEETEASRNDPDNNEGQDLGTAPDSISTAVANDTLPEK